MMHLVEILLPLRDKSGAPFPGAQFERLARELTSAFGGVTSFTRSPAEGRWKDGGKTESDEIVVVEVMVEHVDRAWWGDLRRRLEDAFRQDEIVIRAHRVDRL
jgi:hypothetical protein